jgi:hypothetical protein
VDSSAEPELDGGHAAECGQEQRRRLRLLNKFAACKIGSMKKRFIRVGSYTINLDQIAFIEHHQEGVLIVFPALSDERRRLTVGLKGEDADAFLRALEVV